MIDKKISVSEQVSNLPIEAQLIFTWAIAHTDDVGLLPRSHRTLKAMVVPMLEMSVEQFGTHMETIVSQGLIGEFEHEGDKFYRVIHFRDHQTLKKDRQPQTLLKVQLNEAPKTSWNIVESIVGGGGSNLEPNGIQMEPEVKRSEVKRSEVKYDQNKFDQFWVSYPRKVSKKGAEKVWKKINPDDKLFVQIMAGLEKAKATSQWKKDNGDYVPHPTTWLNQERWNDEVKAGSTGNKTVKI